MLSGPPIARADSTFLSILFRITLEVTEADFEREVVDRSRREPVVVDFWAEWCGPCRTLGPILEQAVAARPGLVLAKVDTDSNQQLARQYGIRGIPAVKAFKDGAVADEFVGALPREAVERFLDRLAPSEADTLVAAGDEQSLRRALGLEPGRSDAAVALARLLLERGEHDQALALVEPIEGDFLAEGLAARIQLSRSGAGEEDQELAAALEALGHDDVERALEQLAAAVANADDDTRDLVRKLMVGLFTQLGPDHPLSIAYRKRLAAALY
jgi:putative thioredoxin